MKKKIIGFLLAAMMAGVAFSVQTQAEIDVFTVLSVSNEQISDMTGVEVFTSLEKL